MKNVVNKIINGSHLKYPKLINIEVTSLCPLNCKQCYKDADNINILNFEFVKKVLTEASEYGVSLILFSGGEPLTYQYIIPAVKLTKELGMNAFISSSGYGLDNSVLTEFKNCGLDILYISLNGSTAEIHNISRDQFETGITAVKNIIDHGISCRINWVARHDNIDDLPNLIKLAKEQKVNGIEVLLNKPDRLGNYDSPFLKADFDRLCEIIQQENGYLVYQNCFYLLDNKLNPNKSVFLKGCSAGKVSMSIFSDESFSPCPHIYTNERYESIIDYWNNSIRLNEIRSSKKQFGDECINCRHHSNCVPCNIVSQNQSVSSCICYETMEV